MAESEIRGARWRVQLGEIAERTQFRFGYVGAEAWQAYFHAEYLSDLIAVLQGAVSLAPGGFSRGSVYQTHMLEDWQRTIAIEPLSYTPAPAITTLYSADVPELIGLLQQLDAVADSTLPDDWDKNRAIPVQEEQLPAYLQPDQLAADFVRVQGSPDNGEVISWNAGSGHWVPSAPSAGGGGGASEPDAQTQLLRGYEADILTKVGIVLYRGLAGTFDADMVESPSFYVDPTTGQEWMLYVGYYNNEASVGRVKVGADGVPISSTREKFFSKSGVVGAPDESGTTGPVAIIEGTTLHLFYIGLEDPGYEAGVSGICRATMNLTNPGTPGAYNWTRHGLVIGPQGTNWAADTIWHPNFVKYNDEWLCFMNATGDPDNKERVGLARAASLAGPWTLESSAPLYSDAEAAPGAVILQGDPFVWWWAERKLWRMDYYVFDGSAYNTYGTTTAEEFPYGWSPSGIKTVKPTPGTFDSSFAHKPYLVMRNGAVYHYYVATGGALGRVIGLAVSSRADFHWTYWPLYFNQLAAARTTSSTSLAIVPQAESAFDRTGKTMLKMRIIARINPGGGTMTVRDNYSGAEAVGNGSNWITVVGPWKSVYGGDGITHTYAQFMVSSGTGSLSFFVYEYRWLSLDVLEPYPEVWP